MIKSKLVSASICPYSKEIRTLLVRDYKYLRTVRQFHSQEDITKGLVSKFIRKMKKTKMVRKLSLNIEPDLNIYVKPEIIQSILKIHSQGLQGLNTSAFWAKFSSCKNRIFNLKNLQMLYITNKVTDIKGLKALRALKSLTIDLTHNYLQSKQLYRSLKRLKRLKSFSILPSPTALGDTVELLNQLSVEFNQPIKFELTTKNDRNYSAIPEFHLGLLENLSKICLHYINTTSVLDNLFIKPITTFPHLKVLKLGFATPDMKFASHLKHIRLLEALEMLSLDFTECWSSEFSEGVIRELRLPTSLKFLKISMALSLKNIIKRDVNNIEQEIGQDEVYPWRYYNLFEEEPLFKPFLQTIENAINLQKIDCKFYMLEKFNSHYTNFFVSMMNRMSSVSSVIFHVVKYNLKRHKKDIPGYFDLALFLNACSRLRNLECIEVYMPNLLFENVELSPDLRNLKGFNIGTTENEDEAPIKIQNIKICIRNVIKTLVTTAPNLTSFVLDFAEDMDERTFCKRFEMIQNFRNLPFLGGRFIIRECSPQTVRFVGRILQSLSRLDTVVLGFYESDKNTFEIKNYLNYHKSIRDVLVTFNKTTWTGDSNQYSHEEDYSLSELGRLESLDSDSIFDTMEVDRNGNDEI